MVRAFEGRDDLLVSNGEVKKAFQAAAFESSILSVHLITAHLMACCPLVLCTAASVCLDL